MKESICDKCGNEFEIVLQNKVIGEIEKEYFVCPECNKSYLVFIKNEEVRKLQKQMHKKKKQAAHQIQQGNQGLAYGLMKQAGWLKRQAQIISDRLKQEWIDEEEVE